MDDAIRHLRTEARRYAHGKAPTAIRYPKAFRAATVALVRAEQRRGIPLRRLAHALGLPRWSLARWLQQHPACALRPVVLTPEPRSTPSPVLITPHGVRVEGLDPDGLVTVLRALG